MSEQVVDRPDGWLLRAWRAGEERAAQVLVERYSLRLVALVARQLNARFRRTIDPEDVVQSAFGSFFKAAGRKSIHVSEGISAWWLLATFAKRKMIRAIEHHATLKRAQGLGAVSIDDDDLLAQDFKSTPTESAALGLIESLQDELPGELFEVIEALVAGQTQSEMASSLGISERTVRRRLVMIRELLSETMNSALLPKLESSDSMANGWHASSLPVVSYGEFVLGKLIGSGGFGKVYRGVRQSDHSTVAVKFLRKAFWQNDEAKRSLIREVNAASQICHPGVIRYLSWGESPHGGPYILSEWIEGQPLQEMREVSVEKFSAWMMQTLTAVEAVHTVGLVHGDLTPNNIMVDQNGRVVITDFGFARSVDDSRSLILGGTPGFAAPEQLSTAFGSIGQKTDVYALGGVIYWYFYGRPPAHGQALDEVLSATLSPQLVALPKDEHVPSEFRQVMSSALQPSPSKRPADVSELIRMLEQGTAGKNLLSNSRDRVGNSPCTRSDV